jgi:hypothetical protein
MFLILIFVKLNLYERLELGIFEGTSADINSAIGGKKN